jgi:hypothetical protein
MRTLQGNLAIVALLLMQLWLSAARGQVICFTADSPVVDHCSQLHEHPHAHPEALNPADHAEPCQHCVHVATPDDPQQQSRPRVELNQHLLVAFHLAPTVAWILPEPAENPMRARWAQPPPHPSGTERVLSLKSTRLLI